MIKVKEFLMPGANVSLLLVTGFALGTALAAAGQNHIAPEQVESCRAKYNAVADAAGPAYFHSPAGSARRGITQLGDVAGRISSALRVDPLGRQAYAYKIYPLVCDAAHQDAMTAAVKAWQDAGLLPTQAQEESAAAVSLRQDLDRALDGATGHPK